MLIACKDGDHEIVKLLLEHGADVHVYDGQKKFPLHHAIESLCADDSYPDLSTVYLLLDYGAYLNAVTLSGETPLYIACSKGLAELVRTMLINGVEVNDSKKSPLIVACQNKHGAIVDLLLSDGADPNLCEETVSKYSLSLHVAAADNNVELVNLLLNHGANVNIVDASGNTALHHVISNFRQNSVFLHGTVSTLLQAGANVNISNGNGETSLYLAVEKALVVFVEDMLSYGGNPNVAQSDKWPLSIACELENMTLVAMLLKAGADPNLNADTDGVVRCELPLCIAANHGNCELTELLLNYGANPNTTVVDLPLCIATKRGKKELAEMLLNAGAEVNMLNSDGKGAMHFAVQKLDVNCIRSSGNEGVDEETAGPIAQLLLEQSSDVNQLMPDGRSVLSLLIVRKHDFPLARSGFIHNKQIIGQTIRLLITKGANLADSFSNVGDSFVPGQLKILKSLSNYTDQLVVDLLKAGAGFRLLASYCWPFSEFFIGFNLAKSVRVCKAAILAGYVPLTEELQEVQQHAELLRWLHEDRQQVPSLMRQCRIAIRRQLSVALSYRTILPAIDQLSLTSKLQQYLKFEGCLSEVDLQ